MLKGFIQSRNTTEDTYTLKVRRWKNIFHASGKQKKSGVAILISDKIDLKIKKFIRDKKGHYIMIKGSVQEEDITIVNICAPNIGAPQYIRQTQTQKEKLTVTQQQEILTLHSHQWTDHQNKINKETQVLNDTLDEIDLIDIFRTFHPNAEEYTFFSSDRGNSPGQTTPFTNQTLVNLRKLKLYQASSPTTML